ncbi:hypothetical protein K788_0007948 [Paraburkholderia caribensis MBA4]|uniref:Uncharacterized protein n=1 Tax=Paraburkholderia caribensis MBA4 TaxID=1323664 RepID=A0A0P0RA07_9BURK|nr:hypothetical protein K788_0007948 [Paraburkholderia caribensis MBA4]
MLLSDERSEILRPPLACENLIGHPEIVSARLTRKDESIACSDKARQRSDASLNFATRAIEDAAFRTTLQREQTGEIKRGGEERKVTSLTLGTGGKRLWLLRSRPDQVDRTSMRGGPSRRILTSLVAPRERLADKTRRNLLGLRRCPLVFARANSR